MKLSLCFLFGFVVVAVAQGQQGDGLLLKQRPPGDPVAGRPSFDTLQSQSSDNLVPAAPPIHFDPGVFELEEKNHDLSITDLLKRVGDLESTSSWIKGGIAGLLISLTFLMGFIKLFWKGIVLLILNEVQPKPVKDYPAPPSATT